ncbi:hypothetical protein ODZ84_11755 [Chryseobacterium fluminis]|uniref:hypothetical protein n=1 Tax=Chryseobacterium fluminis TaxID=2983606 RepID=UPI00224D734B|nr:hypothetical protein [Chryseobacterium sp. MMS21-Ot14]UZT95922.1 hypothetical protein ODZ84_11755 [Chryseobacterium sp. MMS21-Ot14]
MSEGIIIEIPFNEKIERENQRFFFKYLWKRKTTELKKAVIYSIIFLAIGFAPLNDFKQSPYLIFLNMSDFSISDIYF